MELHGKEGNPHSMTKAHKPSDEMLHRLPCPCIFANRRLRINLVNLPKDWYHMDKIDVSIPSKYCVNKSEIIKGKKQLLNQRVLGKALLIKIPSLDRLQSGYSKQRECPNFGHIHSSSRKYGGSLDCFFLFLHFREFGASPASR